METLSMGQMQTLEQLDKVASQLRAVQGKAIRLNMNETPKLSTLALQLLLSAQKSWRAAGHSLLIEGLSEDAIATVNMLGLADQFSPAGGI